MDTWKDVLNVVSESSEAQLAKAIDSVRNYGRVPFAYVFYQQNYGENHHKYFL